jgi:hypothetical protein
VIVRKNARFRPVITPFRTTGVAEGCAFLLRLIRLNRDAQGSLNSAGGSSDVYGSNGNAMHDSGRPNGGNRVVLGSPREGHPAKGHAVGVPGDGLQLDVATDRDTCGVPGDANATDGGRVSRAVAVATSQRDRRSQQQRITGSLKPYSASHRFLNLRELETMYPAGHAADTCLRWVAK